MNGPAARDNIYRTVAMAGRVRRYHTWPVIHQQTVGEHCWRVATIYLEIWGGDVDELKDVITALHHDSGELWAGDTPYSAKRESPDLHYQVLAAETHGLRTLGVDMPRTTGPGARRVKVCDLLEMWEFGRIETIMGNSYGQCVADDTLAAARRLADGIMPDDRHKMDRWKVEKWLKDHALHTGEIYADKYGPYSVPSQSG